MMHCRGICARPEEQLCVSPRRWRGGPSASSCGRGEPRKGLRAGLHAVQVACAAGGRRAAAATRRLQPGRQARRFGLLCRPPAQARAQRCHALNASTHRLRSCSQVSSACVACAWPPSLDDGCRLGIQHMVAGAAPTQDKHFLFWSGYF